MPCAEARTLLQYYYPAVDLSLSAVRRYVFGQPLFLFPTGPHVRAVIWLSGSCFEGLSKELPSTSYILTQPLHNDTCYYSLWK